MKSYNFARSKKSEIEFISLCISIILKHYNTNKFKIKTMKKLLFSLLSLLMACGLAWADGVKVSGEVTIKPGTYTNASVTPSQYNGDSVRLYNESVDLKAAVVGSYNTEQSRYIYGYAFEAVEAGVYTLSYETSVYAGSGNVKVAYSETVTVASENVTQDIEAKDDPTRVMVEVSPYLAGGNPYILIEGIEVTCTKQGEASGETKTTLKNSYNSVQAATFTCDTSSVYTFVLHGVGYKDTTFSTKVLNNVSEYGISFGKSLSVPMKEELGVDVVTLKGSISVEGFSDASKLTGLYLALSWNTKTYVAQIKDGAYEFEDQIPVGEVTYYLSTSSYSPLYQLSMAYVFAGQTKDTNVLAYTLTGTNNSEVVNNLTIKRVSINLTGSVVYTLSM